MLLFQLNHGQINQEEDRCRNKSQDKASAGDYVSRSHHQRSHIKGIAQPLVRPARRQCFVLSQVTRRPGPEKQANKTDRHSKPHRLQRGACQEGERKQQYETGCYPKTLHNIRIRFGEQVARLFVVQLQTILIWFQTRRSALAKLPVRACNTASGLISFMLSWIS